jgi:hypothetical protein
VSTISRKFERVALSDVRDIVVTEIVDDAGQKLRVVRFFGDPIVNNAPTPLYEVESRSASAADLKIQAPGFEF